MDYGIDVSNWNAINDAHRVRAAGISFAWCKATEGTGYTDPTFFGKVAQLRAAGIVVGAYSFLSGSNVQAQAQHFKSVAGPAGCLTVGALMPMIDMEDANARGAANTIVPAFYDAVGVAPQDVYGNLDWWNNVLHRASWGGRDLLGHIARYNGNPGNPGYSADKLAVHQHTDAGNVDGIPGHVDRNATMAGYSLAQICIGGVAPVGPPPVIYVPPPVPAGDTWTVHSGDTLSRIASAWGVTVSALAAANGIADPNLIQIGEIIHKPGSAGTGPAPVASGQTYLVHPGDTLSGIAANHGTSVAVLVALNHIANPDRITAGQTLVLPARAPATPPSPRVYVVQSGDTLGAIAARLGYPGGYPALAARNGIRPPAYTIYPNQQIHY
jgi:LysM repeat protein